MKHIQAPNHASLLRAVGMLLPAVLGVTAVCGLSTQALAQDRAEIDKTRITGNRELPKVLYIVPWKKPEPGELAARPLHSVLDEVLAPLDRDVVRREQHYGAQVRSRAEPQTDAASKP
jgi:hypothetical protein